MNDNPLMMKLRFTLLFILLYHAAYPQERRVVYSMSRGKIHFKSDARLEVINATSEEMRGYVDGSTRTFAFAVNIQSFAGFNMPMQREHFNEKYMESTLYPSAMFKGKLIEDPDLGKDGTYKVRAKGMLNIHGIEQERIIQVTINIKKGMLSFSTEFEVLLQDHHIKVPKVVIEKISPQVKVEVDGEMVRK